MESKLKGKVKFYNDKGYGFITNTETGKDIFFHHTGLLDKVKADDLVEYEMEEIVYYWSELKKLNAVGKKKVA